MSQMLAEISRIVNEDISSRVTQYDVLFEAITNSIQANATLIKCYFSYNDLQLTEDQTGKEIGTIKVDNIRIIDNGDGLTDENYKSFSRYRTKFKKSLGCKGVGRFVFLKIYESAIYVSKLKKEKEVRKVKFDFNFDTEDLKKENANIEVNETEITLNRINPQYYDDKKKIDRRIELDVEKIKEKVLLNLIPTLFFYKEKGSNIRIEFIDEYHDKEVSITHEDIPEFEEIIFPIIDRGGNSHNFKLHYKITEEKGTLYSYYCANNRTVCEFVDKDLKISLPNNYSGFMLLESDFLNEKVNNERNDFDIFPIKTDAFSTLSWEMINTEIKSEISNIIKQNIPHTKTINQQKIKEIEEERPYLVQYIESDDIEMAGFLDKKSIIDKAKKKFDTAKENVLTNSGKEEYTDEELNEAIQLTQNELVSYINDRVLVIDRLKKLVDKQERVESIIHNLFMTKYTKDDYFSVGKNNLWLLDDRFTTYTYAASDKRITDVLKDLDLSEEEIDILNDKPDLSLFFSQDPNSTAKRLKSVLIEIKPFDFSSKPDRKKFSGVQQLIDYVNAFKSRENIDEVYGYLITDVDKKLADRLIGDGYTPLFSLEAPIYHRYYDKMGISIYVVSAQTLINDAEARNKVFLDIIKKQSKLQSMLKK
ncbi:ATP-binding protein [Myroides odoratimimus]|uniref:ATP-binding protein n=1 Tax=Myroides odoratimimus TaxID=76832 RepID=UPI0025788906|nr:ATP-binding protein [Myroides odoratimimus]MDM1094997.1 ATP-binding protein [Myroides odoratimimus]